MTTTPLNWREHMTEEEAAQVETLDRVLEWTRERDRMYTKDRETIRRRITSRVRWERIKAMREVR